MNNTLIADCNLELPGAIRELGPEELAMLKQSNVSDTIKMLNLRKLLNVTVEERAKYEPHIIPIGERAEAVAKAYEERHIATQEALESYEKLAEQYVHAYEERQKLGLDANAFAIYLQLKQSVPEVTAQRAQVINEAFDHYPDYQWNEQQKVKLRADLYKLLYPLCGVVQSVAIASNWSGSSTMKQVKDMNAPAQRAKQQPEYWYDDEEMRWAIQQWATRIGVKVPRVRFQMMPSQWGTITPSGWLTLDPTFLTMPKDLGEFVIVHELVHLLAPKHGKFFKLFMHAYMPDWEERQMELQEYAGVKGS